MVPAYCRIKTTLLNVVNRTLRCLAPSLASPLALSPSNLLIQTQWIYVTPLLFSHFCICAAFALTTLSISQPLSYVSSSSPPSLENHTSYRYPPVPHVVLHDAHHNRHETKLYICLLVSFLPKDYKLTEGRDFVPHVHSHTSELSTMLGAW